MQVKVRRWGNSLGLRLPTDVAERLGITVGTWVQLKADPGKIVISPVRPVYGLKDLLVGMTPREMNDALDWGDDEGREPAQ